MTKRIESTKTQKGYRDLNGARGERELSTWIYRITINNRLQCTGKLNRVYLDSLAQNAITESRTCARKYST